MRYRFSFLTCLKFLWPIFFAAAASMRQPSDIKFNLDYDIVSSYIHYITYKCFAESNCETYHGSEEESECNVRRTESFRRAMARYPSRGFDVQRTSSFHSAKYMDAAAEPDLQRGQDALRYNACRVHSLQNINRKREMDALCDHLVLHLPPEANYNVPRPVR